MFHNPVLVEINEHGMGKQRGRVVNDEEPCGGIKDEYSRSSEERRSRRAEVAEQSLLFAARISCVTTDG